jgi:catechol 2,3-dioxygenase-like lactoylglutathione lyase family enzyme
MADLKPEVRSNDVASAAKVDAKLEVVIIPVSDVDRAKEFYGRLGWRLDADMVIGDSRLIQFTPPGSACSIQFGRNLFGANVKSAAPGSSQGLYLVVSDIQAARAELIARGVDASEVFHCSAGFTCRFQPNAERVNGPHPEHLTYFSFLSFSDPDGNGWLLQEVTTRRPGRVTGNTTYGSVADLSQALRRAEAAHGEHERRTGQRDENWPDWYAEYMVRVQSGEPLPQ